MLIFLAPGSRQFAVIGDGGVHARCGDGFWQELTRSMSEHFRQGDFTAGIVQGIQRAGRTARPTFPASPRRPQRTPPTASRGIDGRRFSACIRMTVAGRARQSLRAVGWLARNGAQGTDAPCQPPLKLHSLTRSQAKARFPLETFGRGLYKGRVMRFGKILGLFILTVSLPVPVAHAFFLARPV